MKRRQRPPAVPPERPGAQLREAGRRNGRFMIVEDQAAPRRVRVIGSLTGDATQVLLDAVDRGVAVVDLSGVDQVDDAAVRVLAWLWPERCTIADCPRWLELWLRSIKGGHTAPG